MTKLILFLLLFALAFLHVPHTAVYAQGDSGGEPFNSLELQRTCQESGQEDNPICQDAADSEDITGGSNSLFEDIVNLLTYAAGVVAVILIIIAGISMMTSGGDAQKFQTARNTIIYTAIGIVIIVASRLIVVYIFDRLAGS